MKAVSILGSRTVETMDGDANNVEGMTEGFHSFSVRLVNGELALVRHALPASTPGVAREGDLIKVYDP